jgi:hypothetical protein
MMARQFEPLPDPMMPRMRGDSMQDQVRWRDRLFLTKFINLLNLLN